MINKFFKLSCSFVIIAILAITSCDKLQNQPGGMSIDQRLDQYSSVKLKADLSSLSSSQKKMIPLLIDASTAMDQVFWIEAYGDREQLMHFIDDKKTQKYAAINYGPWDRLEGNAPFVEDAGPKPVGANFYPINMSKSAFKKWDSKAKDNLYNLIRRNKDGELKTIPYRKAFSQQHKRAANKLKKAADLAQNKSFARYLRLRAQALLTDNYEPSNLAWMDVKNNKIELVIGPIETYEDQLYGYKAAHEAFVLIKDQEWSKKLLKYTKVLPKLQKELPVPQKYKQDSPGNNSDINVYNLIYASGQANAGPKTIAINLPNSKEVQRRKGSRRLQLKNVMHAKYDKILKPISNILIDEDQQKNLSFNAFFNNTMFHEVAHGLGIQHTIDKKGSVREALKDRASALEEGKADIVGLFLITKLRQQGMIKKGSLEDNYVTFVASIFRSIRFGSSDAHAKANLIRFNYLRDRGAVTYNKDAQTYHVDSTRMSMATDSLSNKILTLQGNGNYEDVGDFIEKYGHEGDQLKKALDRLSSQDIPVDVTYKQGVDVLGLKEEENKVED